MTPKIRSSVCPVHRTATRGFCSACSHGHSPAVQEGVFRIGWNGRLKQVKKSG